MYDSENKEKQGSEIFNILEENSVYKAEPLSIMQERGKLLDEQQNSIVKQLHDIDFNNFYLTFEDKNAGRMLDDRKWRRTVAGVMKDGRDYLFQSDEPRTVRLNFHGDEAGNAKKCHEGTISKLVHRGEQLISHPSFFTLPASSPWQLSVTVRGSSD